MVGNAFRYNYTTNTICVLLDVWFVFETSYHTSLYCTWFSFYELFKFLKNDFFGFRDVVLACTLALNLLK